MKDVKQSGLDLGLNEANKLLSKRAERGRISVKKMGEVLNRITPCLHYDGFDDVDIVVEAVVENPRIKAQVLAEVEQQLPSSAILASNTSTIAISTLAQSLERPENFCGMHFFNPVHAMPLVEVIQGVQSSEDAIAATVAYALAMGKKPVVVKDCPGFLVNRVLFPYFSGFAMLLRDGADFQRVDAVMEAWGWPMGPAYLLDVVGIDTCVHAASIMADGYPSRMKHDFTSAVDVLFQAGRFGQKGEGGFYDYSEDKKGRQIKIASELITRLLFPYVEESRHFSDEEIIDRMMIPMVTELARCLEEGVVASVAEADMALVYGLGFPPFRGGVFRWIDSIGIKTLIEKMAVYQSLGKLYHATEGMLALAAEQGSYYPTATESIGEIPEGGR
jgi:3-hydroxyacyl-CoA dehydrogenase/enoyl-CoA hydratase/3-hydroxybutyryl-CoA epimerase/enoyl-CoA isomerase